MSRTNTLPEGQVSHSMVRRWWKIEQFVKQSWFLFLVSVRVNKVKLSQCLLMGHRRNWSLPPLSVEIYHCEFSRTIFCTFTSGKTTSREPKYWNMLKAFAKKKRLFWYLERNKPKFLKCFCSFSNFAVATTIHVSKIWSEWLLHWNSKLPGATKLKLWVCFSESHKSKFHFPLNQQLSCSMNAFSWALTPDLNP